jgi:uncharacterized protein (TIGR02594 family)
MSTTPSHLELARSELGTTEKPGKAANPKVLQYYIDCGHVDDEGKPTVTDDAVSWCAAATGSWLKRCGYPIPPTATNLLARSYTNYGLKLDKPEVGCVGVWPRGASWQGHVGIIAEISADGKTVKLIGGNQGAKGQVSLATYKTADAITFRRPVKATVADLRKAGSKDIQMGDALQKASVGLSLLTGATAAVDAVVAPAETISTALDIKQAMEQAADHLALSERVLKGAVNVGTLVAAHPWIVAIVFTVGAMAILGWKIKQHRLERHAAGHDLSGQVQVAGPGPAADEG